MGVVGASLLIFTAGPAAIFAVPWLQRAHLIADTPLWLLVDLAGRVQRRQRARADRSKGGSRRRVGLQLRAATAAISTAWVVYATGWGSILVIGFGVGIADAMRVHGSRAWKPVPVLERRRRSLGGEIAIALGLAPTDPAAGGRARGRGHHVPVPRAHRAHARLVDGGGREGDRADRARPCRTSGISCSTPPT